MISTWLAWLAGGRAGSPTHSRWLVMGAIVGNAAGFVGVFCFLAVWRTAASTHGLMVDGESSLDWVHRTFVMTTVYTCGSTLLCNLFR